MPSSSSSTAGIMRWRGWGRVPSHIEMATVWPGLASSRSGGPATGARIAVCSVAIGSAAPCACTGCTTVVRSSGSSTRSPSSPYASQTSIALRLVV